MDVDAALQTQIRNIETTYGKPLDHWFAVIDASGLTKHNEVVAMLKTDHGLVHGAARRLSLLARQRDAGAAPVPSDPADALYVGAKAGLRALHDALLSESRALGTFDTAPKRGHALAPVAGRCWGRPWNRRVTSPAHAHTMWCVRPVGLGA